MLVDVIVLVTVVARIVLIAVAVGIDVSVTVTVLWDPWHVVIGIRDCATLPLESVLFCSETTRARFPTDE